MLNIARLKPWTISEEWAERFNGGHDQPLTCEADRMYNEPEDLFSPNFFRTYYLAPKESEIVDQLIFLRPLLLKRLKKRPYGREK